MLARVLGFVLMMLFAQSARAASAAEDCKSYDDTVSIPACTKLITEGTESKSALAAAHNNRGVAYKRRKEYFSAFADYNQAIELDPGLVKARFNRAEAYIQLQMADRAILDLNEAIRIDPAYPKAYALRGLQTYGSNAVAAVLDFDKTLQLMPDFHFDVDPKIHQELVAAAARFGLQKSGDQTALRLLEIADRFDPSKSDVPLTRGGIYIDVNKLQLAEAAFDDAIALEPNNARGYLLRCYVRAQQGANDKAAEDCEKAGGTNVQDAFGLTVVGFLLLKSGKYSNAVTMLTQAIAKAPDAPAAYVYRAQANERLGQRVKAADDYRQAATLTARQPGDQWALASLQRTPDASSGNARRDKPSSGKNSKKRKPAADAGTSQ